MRHCKWNFLLGLLAAGNFACLDMGRGSEVSLRVQKPQTPAGKTSSEITGISATTQWPGTVPWSRVSQAPAFALSSSVSALSDRVTSSEERLAAAEGKLTTLAVGSTSAGSVVMSLIPSDSALASTGYALVGLGRVESFAMRSLAPTPTSHNMGAAVLGTKIYVAGGYNVNGQPCVPNLQEFDLATGRWAARQPMGTPRYGHVVVGARGKVYVTGGYCSTAIRSTEIYNPATNLWTGGAALPDHSHHAAAYGILSDGRLHVVGGYDNTGTLSRTHVVYDFDSNTWSTAREIPAARGWTASGVLSDGRLMVAGGHDGIGCRAEAYTYDPTKDTWTQVASMPVAIHGFQAAVIAGQFHTFGGYNCSAQGNWHYVYDPGTNSWASAAPVPYNASVHNVAQLRGGALLVGGWNSAALTTVYEYLAPLYLYSR